MSETKTIELATATYGKLCSIRDKIDKIVNPKGKKRKISFDDTILVILDTKGIDAELEEWIINDR